MCWTVNEIKKGVWHVDESGLNAMYVVKGSKMSAVIDAGTGIGDFKGLVESLVDNPYVVLITHWTCRPCWRMWSVYRGLY